MQLCVLVLGTGTFPLEIIYGGMLKGINMPREHNMTLDHYCNPVHWIHYAETCGAIVTDSSPDNLGEKVV